MKKCIVVRIAIMLFLFVSIRAGAQIPTEFVAYGTAGYRDNNLSGLDPTSGIGFRSHWFLNPEVRFLFGDRNHAERPRFYLRANPALASHANPVENTLTAGVGVEIRPLIDQYHGMFRAPIWLRPLRIYAEYDQQSFWYGAKPSWSPRHDWVIGFDHWKEFGAVDSDRPDNPDRRWAELFFGAAWHDTDFFQKGYNSIRYGANVRAGYSVDAGRYPVMPYVMVDVNGSTRRSYEFQNRLTGGLGVRTQWQFGPRSRIILFAEQRWLLAFLKDQPAGGLGVPRSDRVVGITFQYNRY